MINSAKEARFAKFKVNLNIANCCNRKPHNYEKRLVCAI